MENKKLLAFIAVIMLTIGAVCVAAAVFLTAPDGGAPALVKSESTSLSDVCESSEPLSSDSSEEESSQADAESSEDERSAQLVLPPGTVLNSPIVLVYDVSFDTVIFARDETKFVAPASLTKLLTAKVALGYLKPEQTLTVGEEINRIGENSSTAFLNVGQKYTVKSMIDALLIPSGNDAAYVLAVNAARAAANDSKLSIEKAISDFVRLMNDEARRLGCSDSVFCTPDGYDSEGQQTTAYDLLKIAVAARKDGTIRESVSKAQSRGWENSNQLIRPGSAYYREEVTGMKTGSTEAAGYNIVVSADIESRPYILLALAAETPDGRYKDIITFLDLIKATWDEDISEAQ